MSDVRRFPSPWCVDKTETGRFVVRDANGRILAHVHAGDENSKDSGCLTLAEALAVAEAIAKLPTLAGTKPRRSIHITPHKQGGWAVRREGAKRATSIHRSLEQAKKAAQLIAQQEGVEVVVRSPGETGFSCVVFGTAWPIPGRKVEPRQGPLDKERRTMRSGLITASLVLLAVVVTTGATLADNDVFEDAQEMAALARANLTLDQAIAAATSTIYPGSKLLEVEVDTENGVPSYVIDVEKDGTHTILVDIRTGEVKTTALESDDIGQKDDDRRWKAARK